MSGDTLILGAFCIFILLLGFRMKQRYREWKQAERQKKMDGSASRLRRIVTIVQLVVLAGLMVYMIPILFRDFSHLEEVGRVNLFLRCLIFIFTIYILIWGIIRLRKQ